MGTPLKPFLDVLMTPGSSIYKTEYIFGLLQNGFNGGTVNEGHIGSRTDFWIRSNSGL